MDAAEDTQHGVFLCAHPNTQDLLLVPVLYSEEELHLVPLLIICSALPAWRPASVCCRD